MTKRKQHDDDVVEGADAERSEANALTLNGHAVHVFEHYTVDDEPMVLAVVGTEKAPRCIPRYAFDDQTGWKHPVSGERPEAEDPTGGALDGEAGVEIEPAAAPEVV